MLGILQQTGQRVIEQLRYLTQQLRQAVLGLLGQVVDAHVVHAEHVELCVLAITLTLTAEFGQRSLRDVKAGACPQAAYRGAGSVQAVPGFQRLLGQLGAALGE